MILEVKEIDTIRTSIRARKKKKVIIYKCDQCQCQFERKFQKNRLFDRQFHLCSYECLGKSRSKDGIALDYQLSKRDMKKWVMNVKQTCQEKYGVSNVSKLEWVKAKKVQTTRKNWGVDNPQQHPDINRRTLETFIKNSSHHWMSKPEKTFRKILESIFGIDDVKVQQLIERKWSIDFYVKSIDTYVQFDGVYWHGLDRPIDTIRESQKYRDQIIYEKWKKDRELDSYMNEKNLRLVRITDVEFKEDIDSCIRKVKNDV